MSQPVTKLERTTAHLNLTTPLSVSDSREARRSRWLERCKEIEIDKLYDQYAGAGK